MNFSYEEIAADSPFVRTILHMRYECDGSFMTMADSSPDVLVIKYLGKAQLFISGTRTKAAPFLYKEGMELMGIRLEVGAFLRTLPQATSQSVWLQDTALSLPDFENADGFVKRLEPHGLIARDEMVEAALQEQPHPKSLRSLQRHFLKTTGMTHSYIRNVERAYHAATLLEQGESIANTVYKAGYFDQAHMTHDRIYTRTTRLHKQALSSTLHKNGRV